MDYFSKNLKPGEEVVEIVRRYSLTYLPHGSLGLVLLLLPFFLLFPLFRWGGWGILIFFILILTAIVFIFRILYVWYFNVFVITNFRLIDIDQRGFFSRAVTEANYEKIQDVSITIKGVFATMFKFGSVHIQTAGTQVQIEIDRIYNPQRIQSLITERQKKILTQEDAQGATPEDLERVVEKLRKHIGDEEFKKALGKDKNLF